MVVGMVFVNCIVSIAALVFSAIGMIRAISAHKSGGAIALGAIGLGLSLLGFVGGFIPGIIAVICGVISCCMCGKEEKLTYEQFKAQREEQRAAVEDPEYAAYLARFEGGDDTVPAPAPQAQQAPAEPVRPSRPTISEQEFARLNLKLKHGTLTDEEQEKYFDYVRKKNGSDSKPVAPAQQAPVAPAPRPVQTVPASDSTGGMSTGAVIAIVLCVVVVLVVVAVASGALQLPIERGGHSTIEEINAILMRP